MSVILLAAGLAAGLLSSIAGLASLVSYPVLLMLGLPPVSANVTNTAALIFTGAGSSLSSLRELHHVRKTVWKVTSLKVRQFRCNCAATTLNGSFLFWYLGLVC